MAKKNNPLAGFLFVALVFLAIDFTNDFQFAQDIPILQDFVPDKYKDSSTSSVSSSSGSKVLYCSSYSTGMCAKYVFDKVSDYDYFKSGKGGPCTYEPSGCKSSGLVGVCDSGTDKAKSGSGGNVQSDLYLYSPSYNAVDAKKTCEGLPNARWK